ncbi:esterase [Acidocella aquatica]|uniref:Esterase n=1 Tax=Acidocella aquatica TaxID=1922313 RepID=A0ABQ6ADR2_9PROT|nr:esterase [Acidocella aquatica]
MQAQAYSNSGGLSMVNFDLLETEETYKGAVDAFRAGIDEMFAKPLAVRLLAQFPVTIEASKIGNIPVDIFTPVGEFDPDHVLINLHGGAFCSGATYISQIESIPVAHLGQYRVVSIDYRQGYEHKFPAATEDVCAVYAELLKTYSAGRIGIYGGSAGGSLTLQVIAWLLEHGIELPGAIAVLGAGAGGNGDGDYFSAIGTAVPPPIDAFNLRGNRFGYFSEVGPESPLINPLLGGKGFLANYPPSLFITGTRAFDLSPAIATQRALFQAGVDAQLHVFDGMGHCFYYDTALPESLDAYDTLLRFFQKHMC